MGKVVLVILLTALACADVQAQDVSVTKDDGSATYVPGTTTTYSVVVTNNGVLAASDVLISDPEPTGPAATFTSWTCTATGTATCPNASGSGSIAETAPSLPGGDSLIYSVVADIPSDALGPLTNEASVSASSPDPDTGNNTASDTNAAEPTADLSITKTGSPDPALPGQPFGWTVTVDNLGPSDAPATTSDTVPSEVTGLSVGGADGASCTVTGQLVACDFGSVPAGTSRTYTITGDLDASATGSVDNTATVTAGGTVTDPVPGNDTSTSITPVIDSSNSVAKTASPASGTVVAVGDTIAYTLTTTVSGASTTDPIVLTDTLDAGLSIITPLPPECSQAGQVLTCTIPAGTPLGDYVINYAATVNTTAGASVGNAVTGGGACPSCSTTHVVARGVSLTKAWANALDGDTVTLSIAGDPGEVLDSVDGGSTAGATTTDATANAVDGATVNISEAFSVGDPLNYATQYECIQVSDGAVLASGTGTAGSFTMPADTDAACTFTNARQAVALSLSKQWNDALQGDTATVSSNGFTNDSTLPSTADATGDNVTIGGPATVYAGDSGTIDETVTNPDNYNSTLACTGNAQPLSGNTLTIDPADSDITCTWTNARKPVNLVLQKTWMSAAIGETVDVTATGSATSPIVLSSIADTATETDNALFQVYAGETLVLSETFATAGNDANYASELACIGTTGLSGDTLVVGPDDTDITCTFTNTRLQATLQLAKAWGANSGTGDQAQIGATTGLLNNTDAFTATAPTPNNSGPAVTVYAGEQATLPAETMPGALLDNYGVALACTGGALSGNDGKASNTLDIQAADQGANIVCTYTNSRTATTLTLEKVWLNAIAGDSIEVVADRPAGGLLPLASTATGGASQTETGPAQDVYAGEVIDMLESFLDGTSNNYDITIGCTNTSGFVPGPGGVGGTLTVGPDDGPITCTWTNDRKSAQLVVQKVWAGPSPGATVDIPATTGFTNNTPAFSSTFPTNDQVGPVEVFVEEIGTLGPESFTDGAPGDFDSTLTCDGFDTDPSNGLAINVADADSTITCTYSNTFVPDPELAVTKTPDVATVTAAGDVITYDISVQNTGNVPLNDVTVTDPLIAATLSCTPAIPVATLAPGATIDCQGTYTVTQADIDRSGSGDGVDDGVINNQVTTSATDDEGTVVSGSDEADVTLPAQVFTIDFTKTPNLGDSDGSGAGSAGETVDYTFSVTNTGNSTIETLTITDPLLPGLACAAPGPIAPGDTVTFGASAPPADVACTDTGYLITQADIDNQGGGDIDIDNEATADGTGPNGGTSSADASASQAIDLAVPAINLDKSASPTSVTEPGQVITYTFVVTNPGNVTLTGVTITDPLPGLGPLDCGADTLPADLAPGASVTCSAQYTVTQGDIDAGGAITNTADADGTYDGADINDEDSATVDVDPGPGTAELVKTADKTSVTDVGEVVTYTFSVNNPGPRTLLNLQITDDTLLGGLSCNVIPSLAPDSSATFTCTGNTYAVQQSDIDNQGNPVADSGELVNTVTGQAEYTDGGDTVTVTDSDSWTVELPPRGPQMVVTKTPDVGSVPGPDAPITYSFQVENIGNVTLENLAISDPLLPGLACDPIASLAPGDTATFTCTGNVYTVTQDDIDTGSSDFQPGDGQIDNEATVSAEVPGGTTLEASDQAEVNLPVRLPAMSLVKSADPATVTEPGTINYTFTVTNDGNVTINDLSVSDPMLGLTCPTVASLGPGASVTFGGADSGADQVCTGTTREVTQDDIDAGDPLDNTATASGLTDIGGTTPVTATDTLQVPIDQNAGLAFTKTADIEIVNNPGEPIVYTITGTNTGNVTLENVAVVDPLIAATLSCTPATPVAALAPGEGFSCTGTYIATQEDFDTRGGGDGVIENLATASWNGGSQNASDDVAIAPQTQSLTIDKSAGTPTVDQGADAAVTDAGDTIPYTFVVENTGNVTLADIAITDPNLDTPAVCDKAEIPATTPPDSVTTCTGVHTITQAEMDAGIVPNSATAQGTPPGSTRISSQPDTAEVILDREPAIELTKTASEPTVNLGTLPDVTDSGDQVTYTFVAENTGNVTLRAVDVTDALMPGVDLVCSPLQLEPGQVAACGTATYTLTQADVDAGVVTNEATATGLDPTDATVSDDDAVDVPIVSEPLLTLAKSGSPAEVSAASQTVTYSFLVTNEGNVTLAALQINEVAFTGSGTMSAITCPATTLAPGASTTCTATYAVSQADIDQGSIDNAANATATTPELTPVTSNDSSFTVTVDLEPAMVLTKTATLDDPNGNTTADAGEVVTYTVSVGNSGNVTLSNLVVTDVFEGGAPTALSCAPTTLEPTQTATCVAYTHVVTQDEVNAGGALDNTATATADPPTGAAVTAADSESVPLTAATPELTLTKTATLDDTDGSTTADAEEVVTYTVEVQNTGNVTLVNLAVTDIFEGGAPTTLGCAPAALAPGDTATCTSYTHVVTQAEVDAGGTLDNTATAMADPPTGAAVTADDSESVPLTASTPGLTVTKTVDLADGDGNTTADAGEIITYTVSVENTGNVTLSNLTVTDVLEGGAPTTLGCSPTTLAPGDTATCTAYTHLVTQADVDAGGTLDNTATATAEPPTGAAITVDDNASVPLSASSPLLTVTKTAVLDDLNGNTTADAGETINYTVEVQNNGNVTLSNLAVTDVFEGGTPTTLSCAPTTLAPGDTATCDDYTHLVTQAEEDAGGTLDNTATATADPPTGAAVTAADSESVELTPADPELTLAKTVTPTTATGAGDTVAYSFEVTNTGNVTIDNLSINETEFSGTGTPPTVSCPVTTLAPTEMTLCTSTDYTVTQADVNAGVVDNTAQAVGTDPAAAVVTSVDASAQVTIAAAPALTLVKTVTPTTAVAAGDLVTYSFDVTNSGNVTIDNLSINETVFSGTGTPPTISCPVTTLAPTETTTCTSTDYAVTQADVNAGVVDNTAQATGTDPAAATVTSADASAQVTIAAAPALVLDKTATVADTNGDGITGNAGDTITYAFSMQNTGNVSLAPVTVSDPLLPALDCSLATLDPGETASCAATGNTYVITVADETNGTVDNTATGTGDAPGPAPDPTATDTETTPTQVTPAATTVLKTSVPASGEEVAPGDTITFTVTATVANAALHEEITLTDTIGDGMTFVAVTDAGAFTCNAANPLVCTLPAGTAQGSYPLVYTATVDADATGSVGNSVIASKDPGVDPDPVCTTCDTDHPVVPATTTVNKSSDPASGTVVVPGDTLAFTLSVEVSGSALTQPLTLTDTPGPGLTFGSVTSAGDFTCSGSLVCTLPAGTLPGTYEVTYTATVDADASGVVVNNVVPTNPPDGDPDPVCGTCSTDHTVARPSLETAKEMSSYEDLDGNGEVSTGDILTYTVTATNTGNVPLANVIIRDPMIDPASTTCPLLAPGEVCTLEGIYTVVQADTDAGQVVNDATSSAEPPPDYPPLPPEACPAGSTSSNCAADNVTPVIQRPAIAATKTAVLIVDNATPGKGNIDDVITYSVTATNTGNITLADVVVTDTFQNGTPVTLSCAPTVLTPGQTATCASYEHVITEAEVHSGEEILLNTILAQGNAGTVSGTIEVTATAAAEIEVQNEPAQLRLSKVAGVRQVNIGDLVRYTLTVENTGDIDLVDGYLIDTPAPGFTYVDGSLQGDDDDDFVTASGSSPLRVSDLDIAAGNSAILTYLMRVGAGVQPGVQINRAVAFDPAYDGPASNVATAEVVLGSDPLLDESLISGTAFNDRDGDGWQDGASLTDVRAQGGFAPGAYIAGSTTIDRGDGPQPKPDASAPLLHGIDLDRIEGRQSVADPASAHQVVIRQHLHELAFTDDFVLTNSQGATVRMAADGSTTVEKDDDAAKGLTAAAPTVEREVVQAADGYEVAYVVRNEGIAERGIPGVRIASVEGLLMETDQYGRYHLVGIDAGQSARGRNFILKVDTATLPPAAELTTENPKVRRVTGGVPTRFDFGVRLPEQPIRGSRVVEMEIGAVLFAPGSAQVQPHYLPVIDSMVEQVEQHGGGEVVITSDGETEALAFARANAVGTLLDERLEDPLRGQVALSVRADADDPASLVAGVAEGGPVLGTLLFDTDRATIQPRFDALLDEVARVLASSGGDTVSIIGHADRRGSREYNAALGLRRASAVHEALVRRLPPDARQRLRVEVRPDPDAPLEAPQGEVGP
ncbi:DUF7507 domain-containing protein [Lysobacter sp. F60174L2]|uniref:DUF7507 domain-containing protein n=1 Tax=Lysobacter sp. F60174L2 TaxID=3459295 RepID=UPI00403E2A36